MAILEILQYPDSRLHLPAARVEKIDAATRKLVSDMAETMYAAEGVGLAATQVNVHQQVIVIDVSDLNQTPFDMSEAESELVAGFASEYSAVKFRLLFLSEFSNMIVVSALAVTLFLGGWHGGFGIIPAPIVLVGKTYVMIFVLMWIRGTFPRVRIDRLLSLGWKVLIPATLALTMITGLVMKVAEAVAV